MFLRSLSVRGFKSFADRMVLEFGPGLSVIVGPNGSGKSNLVDAIAWVLGEQGPGALRGSQMADVIFSGSPGRQALGTAEVALVIDNEAGLIPIEASEVEIGRVIYRSGESQYLIAGEACRLTDIRELLSDTGIGRGLHTLVGQGQLEDVLVARPEDRRQYIEEAAGIAKHRRRKEQAQRKLERMEQDLLRLQDVLRELRRQLRPLKQQAAVAERHEALSREAEGAAGRLVAARLRELYAERVEKSGTWQEGLARRAEQQERLAGLDAEIARGQDAIGEADRVLAEAEQAHADALARRAEAERAVREAVKQEGEARARAAEEASGGRLFSLEEEIRRTESALEETRSALAAREVALQEAEQVFRDAEVERRRLEEERAQAEKQAAAQRASRETDARALAFSQAERDQLVESLSDLAARADQARAQREAIEEEIERLDAAQTLVVDRQQELERERTRLLEEIAHLDAGERRLEVRRQAIEARAAALEETASRKLLRRAPGRAVGVLGELLRAEAGAELALAAALGSLAEAVVYEDQDRAVADVLETPGATIAIALSESATEPLPAKRGMLSLVRVDPRVRGLAERLLRGVYLVASPQEALANHREHPGSSFVTSGGVLVGRSVVRSAPVGEDEGARLTREAKAVAADLARVRGELSDRRARAESVEAELARVLDDLARSDSVITAAADRMARTEVDLATLGHERGVLEQRLERVTGGVRAAEASLASRESEVEPPPLPPTAEPPITLRVEVEALRRDRGRLEAALEHSRKHLKRFHTEGPTEAQADAERATTARREAEAIVEAVDRDVVESSEARRVALDRVSEVRSGLQQSNEGWRTTAALLGRLRDDYEEEDRLRGDLERRIEEAERTLADGHGRDPADEVAELEADDTEDSLQHRADLIARRLALLGRVNQVAAEEYQALQERHEFLARELDDVRAARRDLQRVIADVDRTMLEVFQRAFDDVADEFSKVFGTLFPNGEGRLSLTEAADPLEAGIEIDARPGRKRVKRISLLSGGERALTALAFLFAIFRARPSPFYLLDEVEAALDDVNLVRFLELVGEFTRSSQVLLVTHQKRTMEAADILYGVSMGNNGASRVIAERLRETAPEPVPAS
ncbi:MAG: chromosome segregation SMC family protein [Actinomycetota bacterium]